MSLAKALASPGYTRLYMLRKYRQVRKEALVRAASRILRHQGKPATYSHLRTQTKEALAIVVVDSDLDAIKSPNRKWIISTRRPLVEV